MFNRKSIYALNKKDPNAIVYTDADGRKKQDAGSEYRLGDQHWDQESTP